jgi:hypothetical protein
MYIFDGSIDFSHQVCFCDCRCFAKRDTELGMEFSVISLLWFFFGYLCFWGWCVMNEVEGQDKTKTASSSAS